MLFDIKPSTMLYNKITKTSSNNVNEKSSNKT